MYFVAAFGVGFGGGEVAGGAVGVAGDGGPGKGGLLGDGVAELAEDFHGGADDGGGADADGLQLDLDLGAAVGEAGVAGLLRSALGAPGGFLDLVF